MGRFVVRLKMLVRALVAPRRRPSEVKRILIAHYLLLGDTLLLAPLMKSLAARFPNAERVILVRPAFMPLFSSRPYGVTAVAFDRKSVADRQRIMASGPYDVAIVPDDNRYAWLARASGARWIIGFAADRPKWKNFMIDEPLAYDTVPSAWADMAARLGGAGGVPVFQAGEWPAPVDVDMTCPETPYAVLHVGASTPLKQWAPDRWRALANTLTARGMTVVWTGGANEQHLLAAVGVAKGEVDLVGTLDLGQLWALLQKARLVVCPDTGIAHLARLIGVPTFALFGPGSAIIHGAGVFWNDAPFVALTDPDIPCRDQHVLFRRDIAWVRRCGRSFGTQPGQCARPICMEALSAEEVINAVQGSGLIGDAAAVAVSVATPRSPVKRQPRAPQRTGAIKAAVLEADVAPVTPVTPVRRPTKPRAVKRAPTIEPAVQKAEVAPAEPVRRPAKPRVKKVRVVEAPPAPTPVAHEEPAKVARKPSARTPKPKTPGA